MKSKLPTFGGGVALGFLLALSGGYALKDRLVPKPEVTVIEKEKVVEKVVKVFLDKETPRLYRASLLNEDGTVAEQWEITKCKFLVLGASLTDTSGKTFEVRGRIKIEPVRGEI
jgi:hypothetical protein